MKKLPFFLFLALLAAGLNAQHTVRILVLNHSANPPKSEKGVTITPLTGGGNAGSTNDAGLFDIKLSTAKPGDRLDLIVNKTDYQILGPDPRIFNYAVPNDANEYVRIAIIKASDFNAIKADFEAAIEKRIKQATAKLDMVIDSLQKAVTNDVRNALAKTIAEQNNQINELRKNKEELATQLAQVDLEQASEFARLALKKFKEEGDVKAALALMPEDKMDVFWDNVLLQEEKVKKAKEQGVENYMIRARLLKADFQLASALKNYQLAIQRDSNNVRNLWEFAYSLAEQRQDQRAIQIYIKALTWVKIGVDRASILNNLGNLYYLNQKMSEAENTYLEALEICRKLVERNPEAFTSDLARTLTCLGAFYSATRKMPEAEKICLEALNLYRELVAKDPDTFSPDLVSILNNLGLCYSTNQKMPEAEKAYFEALDTCRKLVVKNPDTFGASLALTLQNLSNYYYATMKMLEAEKTCLEAIEQYRQLVTKNPDAFTQDLARTLNNLAGYYFLNQKMPEAEKVFLEVLELNRQLVSKNPEIFVPDLVNILNNLGVFYTKTLRFEFASRAYNEALAICLKAALEGNVQFSENLRKAIQGLSQLRNSLAKSKNYIQTIEITQTLANMWEALTKIEVSLSERSAKEFGNLARYNLFIKKYSAAQAVSEKGLRLDPTQTWINTNLAHSLLYQGEFQKAQAIYQKLKDQPYDDQGKTYREVFLKDLDDLEKEGITHPDVEKVRKLLQNK